MGTISPEQQALNSAAKRVSSQFNLHAYVGCHGQWAAFRLSDGTSDGATYPTRGSAISHTSVLNRHMFLKITPNGLTPEDAERLLVIYRNTDDRGYRASVDQPSFILPITQEDISHWIERSAR